MKVNKFNVSTDYCDVDVEVVEFDDVEDMLCKLEEEFEEDINGESIRELWDEEKKEIVIEGDVWFGKWKVIE